MKIEYVYTCCRCGKEFKGNAKLFGTAKVNVVKYESYLDKLNYAYEEICPECFRELKWWLRGNSTSIDEIKRLHTDIEELKRQLDMSKEMIINRDKEISKLKGEIASLNDRCSWFLEEVDTPHGKCTRSKDWKKLKEAKEIINNLLSDNRIMKAEFESEEQAHVWFKHIHEAEQFLRDNFPNENLEDVVK